LNVSNSKITIAATARLQMSFHVKQPPDSSIYLPRIEQIIEERYYKRKINFILQKDICLWLLCLGFESHL